MKKVFVSPRNTKTMPKIYTKTGDEGTTSLYCGTRVVKTDPIFDVLGYSDELSSRIGMLIAFMPQDDYDILRRIQQDLQDINSILATTNEQKREKLRKITEVDVQRLERKIDTWDAELPKLTRFILPGGVTPAVSQAHLCRTQARTLERKFWAYYHNEPPEYMMNIAQYLNRLSDYFFVLGRYLEKTLG